MTGTAGDRSPPAVEPKRRLSLRLNVDKRVKSADGPFRRARSGSRGKDLAGSYEGSTGDDDPSSSSSARYALPARSAGSSETDDGSEWAGRRARPRRSPRVPEPTQRAWPDDGRDGLRARPKSGDGNNDPGSERMPSPPPSMMLSTGQPLVNPPPKTQTGFVGKLYSMLEDDEIGGTGFLYWANNGSTFVCPNPTEFARWVIALGQGVPGVPGMMGLSARTETAQRNSTTLLQAQQLAELCPSTQHVLVSRNSHRDSETKNPADGPVSTR